MELSKNAHKWYNHIIYLLSFTDIENPIKSKEIEKKSVELFEKKTNKSILGVESKGEFYTDNTLSEKLDKTLYTKKSPTDVKFKDFFLEDRTAIPLKVVNGELRRTTKVENHLHGSGESLF